MPNTNIVDFFDHANWTLMGDVTLTALAGGSPNTFIPIPDYTVGPTMNSPIIAYSINCSHAKPYWKYGGHLRQVIQSQLDNPSIFNVMVDKKYRLELAKTTILTFLPYILTYGIKIEIPFYFQDIRIMIWEYTLVDTDILFNMASNTYTDTQAIRTNLGI